MIKKVILLVSLTLLLSSCENSTDVAIDLSYTEYTVVNAQLTGYKVFQGVALTNTLPLDEPYDINKAEIKDAVMYMVENGIRIIPLHYTSNGVYKPLGEVIIQVHSQYELFVSIGSKTIYSKTIVPAAPEVLNLTNIGYQYLSAEVNAIPGEAYGAAWLVSSAGELLTAPNFFEVVTPGENSSTVNVRCMDIPYPYNSPAYSNEVYIKVFAFDRAYKDYFKTRIKSGQVNNTFTAGGGAVAWNVAGDHVIGLFIGMTAGQAVHQ